jgi:hypothetical protein
LESVERRIDLLLRLLECFAFYFCAHFEHVLGQIDVALNLQQLAVGFEV